jgi:hypothetical protein
MKGLVVAVVVLLATTTSFFTAMTVYEQLNIHWLIDLVVAGTAGIATALFQASLIGFSRYIQGVPGVKVLMVAAACFLTSLTIMGVYSAMQSSFFRNVVDSGNYQRLSRQSDLLQKKFERQLELDHVTKSEGTAKQLEATNRQLSDVEKSGSGAAQNQWATNLSDVLGVNSGAVSFGRHTVIGFAIDLCYYLALWFLFYGLLFREKTPTMAVLPLDEQYLNYDEDYPKWKNGNGNGNGRKMPISSQLPPQNGDNGQVEKKNNTLNSQAGVEARRKEKEKNKSKLMGILENSPELTSKVRIAQKLGVSTETLNNYLKELEKEGKISTRNLHTQNTK